MENAIGVLQDRVIFLTGRSVVINEMKATKLAKDIMLRGLNEEMEELKKAQEILINTINEI